MSLKKIAELSNYFGSNPAYVLAGGGNTSYKDEAFIFVKPSGISLAEVRPEDFVKLERRKVRSLFTEKAPEDLTECERFVKSVLAGAVSYDSTGRPSVETPLHEVLPGKYVVHLHPTLVNGMTCGKKGREICTELFPDAYWIEYCNPGYALAIKVHNEIAKIAKEGKEIPKVLFLANHGVFVSGDDAEEIKMIYEQMLSVLKKFYESKGVKIELERGKFDQDLTLSLAPKLRSWLSQDKGRVTIISSPYFKVARGPLTPDHIVYAKSFSLERENHIEKMDIEKFEKEYSYKPQVVAIKDKVVFCAGATLKDANVCLELAQDAALVDFLAESFGGANYLTKEQYKFIEGWEAEAYRKKVSATKGGRLFRKVAAVTGAAQGFGFGIALGLAREGAVVAVCDINYEGAKKAVEEINQACGKEYSAFPVQVNVTDEESVKKMMEEIVLKCGGVDIFISNAGVLKAGSVKTFEKSDWDFVTAVNYTGYFLCVKYASRIMAIQNVEDGGYSDIIQINSKSGLEGSAKNAAYAGSKFGGIGLTQSFALELVEDRIKVNSICPGNYFEGPLWSDPEKGLFVQYLKAGKVPGAKNIDDVKRFYESKVPMGRGCYPEDVVKAIIYCVEQEYETGQAIPVSGGQIMLN